MVFRVSVVFFSKSARLVTLANVIAEGARAVEGADVRVLRVRDTIRGEDDASAYARGHTRERLHHLRFTDETRSHGSRDERVFRPPRGVSLKRVRVEGENRELVHRSRGRGTRIRRARNLFDDVSLVFLATRDDCGRCAAFTGVGDGAQRHRVR
jgi:hypothetical protein